MLSLGLFHPAGHSARLLKHRLYTGSAWSLWSGLGLTANALPALPHLLFD